MKYREKEERKVLSFPKYSTLYEDIVMRVTNYKPTLLRTDCTAK